MNRMWSTALGLISGCLLLAGLLRADVVTLKDGRVIVAKKVIKSGGKVFLITDKGKETFDEDQIASIVAGDQAPPGATGGTKPPASAPAATPTSPPKESAPPAAVSGGRETVVENMEMLYRLGKYDELVAAGNGAIPPAAKLKTRLLIAKAYCRQGKFTDAEKAYLDLAAQGTAADKAYAKACLDILKANPDGVYKGAAGLSAVELMNTGQARDPKNSPATQEAGGTLKDEKVFDSALRAHAIQTLKEGDPLMTKLKAAWKPELTAGDFEKSGGGKVALHYEADKKKLVALYDQADAISPGVSASIRKELVRQEAEHIESVLIVLADKIEELGPGGSKTYMSNKETHKMTITAQKEWQQQTDKAVYAAKIALAAANNLVGLYKLNEADFEAKIREAEGKKSQIEGQITGLIKDRDRQFLK